MRRLWLAAAASSLIVALVGSEVRVSAGQAGTGQPTPPVFTAEQASAGKVAYSRSCAKCHMPDLGGTPDAPPLSGNRFLDTWRSRTTKQLFDFVLGAMPPGGPAVNGDIKADTYADDSRVRASVERRIARRDSARALDGIASRSRRARDVGEVGPVFDAIASQFVVGPDGAHQARCRVAARARQEVPYLVRDRAPEQQVERDTGPRGDAPICSA